MFLSGLCLKEVPTALVQQAGRSVQDFQIQAGQMSLSRWQPDIVGILLAKKNIAICPEVTLPSDSWLLWDLTLVANTQEILMRST